MKRDIIDLNELKVYINLIMDHVIETKGEEIVLEEDYYWSIPDEDIYDMKKSPDCDIGQLFDDLEFLRKTPLQAGEFTLFHLTYVASLLSYIASDRYGK